MSRSEKAVKSAIYHYRECLLTSTVCLRYSRPTDRLKYILDRPKFSTGGNAFSTDQKFSSGGNTFSTDQNSRPVQIHSWPTKISRPVEIHSRTDLVDSRRVDLKLASWNDISTNILCNSTLKKTGPILSRMAFHTGIAAISHHCFPVLPSFFSAVIHPIETYILPQF